MDIGGGSFDKISAYVDAKNLAAATAETITKPAGYAACWISADAACYYRRGGTAVANVADISDGTASIYLPANQRRLLNWVDDGDGKAVVTPLATLSIISTAGGNVTIEWLR